VVFWVVMLKMIVRFLKNIGNTTLHDVTTQKTAVDIIIFLTSFLPFTPSFLTLSPLLFFPFKVLVKGTCAYINAGIK
jgi:hypothetical protein